MQLTIQNLHNGDIHTKVYTDIAQCKLTYHNLLTRYENGDTNICFVNNRLVSVSTDTHIKYYGFEENEITK